MSITAHVMGPQTRTRDVLSDGRSAVALRGTVPPDQLHPSFLEPWLDRPVSLLVAVAGVTEQAQAQLWAQLAAVPRIHRDYPPATAPRDDIEPDTVPVGSAEVEAPVAATVNVCFEVKLSGPSHGNPFVDVELTADFTSPTAGTRRVGGFYDGDGVYRVRFMPPASGVALRDDDPLDGTITGSGSTQLPR